MQPAVQHYRKGFELEFIGVIIYALPVALTLWAAKRWLDATKIHPGNFADIADANKKAATVTGWAAASMALEYAFTNLPMVREVLGL